MRVQTVRGCVLYHKGKCVCVVSKTAVEVLINATRTYAILAEALGDGDVQDIVVHVARLFLG